MQCRAFPSHLHLPWSDSSLRAMETAEMPSEMKTSLPNPKLKKAGSSGKHYQAQSPYRTLISETPYATKIQARYLRKAIPWTSQSKEKNKIRTKNVEKDNLKANHHTLNSVRQLKSQPLHPQLCAATPLPGGLYLHLPSKLHLG